MKITGNEPAMPTQCPNSAAGKIRGGLTIRQQFAMAAMQGICADPTYITPNQIEGVAKYAVSIADALIAELNKEA